MAAGRRQGWFASCSFTACFAQLARGHAGIGKNLVFRSLVLARIAGRPLHPRLIITNWPSLSADLPVQLNRYAGERLVIKTRS